MRRTLLLVSGHLLLTGVAAAQDGGAPTTSFTASQEASLLDANKAVAAAERCDFVIDDRKLDGMLLAAGITQKDAHTRKQSPGLKSAIAGYRTSFRGNKEKVCADAYASFGKTGLLRIRK